MVLTSKYNALIINHGANPRIKNAPKQMKVLKEELMGASCNILKLL
jgi:hypothetical protein